MPGTLLRDFEPEARTSTSDQDDFAVQVWDAGMIEVAWIQVINDPFHRLNDVHCQLEFGPEGRGRGSNTVGFTGLR